MPAFTHDIVYDFGYVRLQVRYDINPGWPGDGMTPREDAFPEGIRCKFECGVIQGADGVEIESRNYPIRVCWEYGRKYLAKYEDEINEAVERHFHERQDGLRGLSGGEG
jgi:hypothetical protein